MDCVTPQLNESTSISFLCLESLDSPSTPSIFKNTSDGMGMTFLLGAELRVGEGSQQAECHSATGSKSRELTEAGPRRRTRCCLPDVTLPWLPGRRVSQECDRRAVAVVLRALEGSPTCRPARSWATTIHRGGRCREEGARPGRSVWTTTRRFPSTRARRAGRS